jgi:hypothetical protein
MGRTGDETIDDPPGEHGGPELRFEVPQTLGRASFVKGRMGDLRIGGRSAELTAPPSLRY